MSVSRSSSTVDRNYTAAGQVQKEERRVGGKIIPFDLSVRRKAAIWASYNDRIERACASQSSQR